MNIQEIERTAYSKRLTGDICIYYHWDKIEGKMRPCMSLYPKYPALSLMPKVATIPIKNAHECVDSRTGAPTHYLIQCAHIMCVAMGMYPDASTLRRIADIIVDGIPDLVGMPPFSERRDTDMAPPETAELVIKRDGETIHHSEVAVPEGFRA